MYLIIKYSFDDSLKNIDTPVSEPMVSRPYLIGLTIQIMKLN